MTLPNQSLVISALKLRINDFINTNRSLATTVQVSPRFSADKSPVEVIILNDDYSILTNGGDQPVVSIMRGGLMTPYSLEAHFGTDDTDVISGFIELLDLRANELTPGQS